MRWYRYGDPTAGGPFYDRSLSVTERFWGRVDRRGPDECWPWTASLASAGYGTFNLGDRHYDYAHRIAYEWLVGPIPAGLTVDHTCHNADLTCAGGDTCRHRRCCNPAHLEAVTHAVNIARAARPRPRKTHCIRGHPFDETNTGWKANGSRRCRACSRDYARRKANP